MKKDKTISSIEDIMAVIYMAEYAQKEYFPSITLLTDTEFKKIEDEIETDYRRKVSSSSIRRIIQLREKPHRISYDKLDSFTVWCFDNDYSNFKNYLQEKKRDIVNSNLISSDEAESILKELSGESTDISIIESISPDLGEFQVSYRLGEGYIEKLIKAVSIVTGDLLTKKIKNNPREFGMYPTKRINIRFDLKEKRRQKNIDSIITKAIEFAREKEASQNPVDPDWIVEFFNIAQDCSHENMQYLWAKILAGEVKNPTSFSKRTLNLLKSISANEAELFSLLSNCLWTLKGEGVSNSKMLITDSDENGEYSDLHWGFDRRDIYLLEDLGLIEESIYILNTTKYSYQLDFFNIKHSIKSSKKRTELDILRLTKVGEEIYSIVQKEINQEYYEYIKGYLIDKEIIN